MEQKIKRSEVEIMAPVGSYESLMAAIQAHADSIYFGVEKLNMRAGSSANFTLDDLARIVATAREHGIKTYLTVNTILYDQDIEEMHRVLDRALAEGIDAVIASDQAAILYARSIGLEVHISTQLNLSNIESVAFYAQYADVVVLARELSIPQVKAISRAIRERDIRGPHGELLRIEMFAHGALCMAISGKCYLSLHDNTCSANRGSCRQICRRSYIVRDKETGEELEIKNHYIMSPKDLCTIDFLDLFLDAGVRVLKIEGRRSAPGNRSRDLHPRTGNRMERAVEYRFQSGILARILHGGTGRSVEPSLRFIGHDEKDVRRKDHELFRPDRSCRNPCRSLAASCRGVGFYHRRDDRCGRVRCRRDTRRPENRRDGPARCILLGQDTGSRTAGRQIVQNGSVRERRLTV